MNHRMIHYTSSSYGFEKRIFTLPLPPSTSNFISKSAMLVNPVFNFNKRVQQKRNPQKPHTTLEINVHTSGTLNRDCPEGIPALSWATWRCSENGTRGCNFPRHGALLASDASLVGLTLNAQVHDVVPADGTIIHLDVPRPQGNSRPLFHFKAFLWGCHWWRRWM